MIYSNLIKVLSVIILFTPSYTYRILGLFPITARSHFNFFHPILRGLAEAGHNVTVLSYFPDKNPPENYKDIPFPGDTPSNPFSLTEGWVAKRLLYGHLYEISILSSLGYAACQDAYNSTQLKSILKSNEKYDVILLELFHTDCMLGVAWQLQSNVIGLSSSAIFPWYYDDIGTPQMLSFMPSIFREYGDNMTFSQRFWNFLDDYLCKFIKKYLIDRTTNTILKEQFGNNIPSIEELRKSISAVFVNQHYSLSGSKPLSPNLIELGGIHIGTTNVLDVNFKEFLDNAVEGVIYVSWGSLLRASTMPADNIKNMLNAFGKLKQKVLWKYEDEIDDKPLNVFTHKWLPQLQILCHPNVLVFWSHGGNAGFLEATNCGKAVVTTPIFGDQFLNAAAVVNRGMGAIINYDNMTVENILNSINIGLNPMTQQNAKNVSFSFQNRMQSPIKTSVWWVEHVAASGGAVLAKSYSLYLPGYVYHSFDVYAVLLIGLSISLTFWICILKKFFFTTKIKSKTKAN